MNGESLTEQRLAALERVEQSIVELLKEAITVIRILNGETSDADSDAVQQHCQRYYALLETIQLTLRQHFRYLTDAGITDVDITFRSPVAGWEKDQALWLTATAQLRTMLQQARLALSRQTDTMATTAIAID